MLFNSIDFVLFFCAFVAAWPLLRRWNNARWGYLIAASFFFYGWWDWRFLFLLLVSGTIDFLAALGMTTHRRWRRPLLVLSLIGNLGLLATLKYLDFAIGNFNALTGWFGHGSLVPLARLTLPVGISFYTFQSMSYTIDVYRGCLEPTRNPLHFFAYLSMFPQLVAGPIVRASHLLPQLKHARATTETQRWEGLRLVVLGYFKKMVVADNLAPVVNTAFDGDTLMASGAYWWIIALMFAFQIYCDFSGYSDIARGLARWMGYDFPLNFDHPYIAGSFREFWQRWHISLSTWFRDYVYIPLGGSRCSAGAAHANMWITMVLSGLWHGASWTFIAWGALHAAFLSLERAANWPRRLARIPGGNLIGVATTLIGVLIAWVFFRAQTLTQAVDIVCLMLNPAAFNLDAVGANIHWRELLLVAIMAFRHALCHPGWQLDIEPRRAWPKLAQPVFVSVLVWACIYLRGPGSAFVYFQF